METEKTFLDSEYLDSPLN